jgi:DNA polymerase-4
LADRTILHVDMDAFFAAVEQRDNPEYRGKPLIVGGTGRRGVVSTASYEARKFGVGSAMPTFKAKKACPHGIFIAPRMSAYVEASRQIMEVFSEHTPAVEPLSLDEAFLDMTGCERLFGTPPEMAESIRALIFERTALTASVGCAANKFVAKVASDMNKPDGVTVCTPGSERAFLAPLAIRRLWGVGPRAAAALQDFGVQTVGDITALSLPTLERRFGNFGRHVWELAHGRDDRSVQTERRRVSMGAERTLSNNITGVDAVRHRLLPLADEVTTGLRAKNLRAWGIRLKVKYADFTLTTRDMRVSSPICDAGSMLEAIDELLQRIELNVPIRLVGLAAFELSDDSQPQQASLFEAPSAKREGLESALDSLRSKFGSGTVVRGSWLGDEAAEKKHDWGPDD